MTGSSPWKTSDGKALTTIPVKNGDFTGWLRTITTKEGAIKTQEELRQRIVELKAVAERLQELRSKFDQAKTNLRK
jgi:hypothetical protein